MSCTFSYLNFLDVFMFIYVYLGAKLLNQAQLDEAVSELQVNMLKIYPLIFVLFSPSSNCENTYNHYTFLAFQLYQLEYCR